MKKNDAGATAHTKTTTAFWSLNRDALSCIEGYLSLKEYGVLAATSKYLRERANSAYYIKNSVYQEKYINKVREIDPDWVTRWTRGELVKQLMQQDHLSFI